MHGASSYLYGLTIPDAVFSIEYNSISDDAKSTVRG